MKRLEVSDETYAKIKDQLLEDEGKDIHSFSDMIGGKYFFRTVTYFVLGRVKKQVGQFFELEGASWIPNTGRFMQFLNGELNEVEPTGKHFVNIETVVDFFEYPHDLPTKQE